MIAKDRVVLVNDRAPLQFRGQTGHTIDQWMDREEVWLVEFDGGATASFYTYELDDLGPAT